MSRPDTTPKTPDKPAPAPYAERADRMNEEYELAWKEWICGQASYGVRSLLKSGGKDGSRVKDLHRPMVERSRPAGSDETREDHGREMERLSEMASHERTADVVIGEGESEPGDVDTRRLEEAEKEAQRLMNRHFHFFAMFIGTGAEQFDLVMLRCLVMLRHAAPYWLTRYGLHNGKSVKEMDRLRARVRSVRALGEGSDYIPFADVLTAAVEDDEEEAALQLGLDVRAWRLLRFGEFCGELGKQSKTLPQFAKNCVAWLRRVKQQEVSSLGKTLTAVADKLGERKATTSAREINKVEAPQKKAGMRGYHDAGAKSESHRKALAKAQMGNRSRVKGEARKRARRRRY